MLVKNNLRCPDQAGCGSSDGASVDDSGTVYCWSCIQTFRDQPSYKDMQIVATSQIIQEASDAS